MSNELPRRRLLSMDHRRQRIRDAARDLLVTEGVDALTTRRLAAAAGVTPPTLYNLIGPIEDILTSLIEEGVDRIQEELDRIEADLDGLELAERVVTTSVDVFTAEARAFKAIGLAIEKQALSSGPNPAASEVVQRCVALQLRAVRRAQSAGTLKGDVDALAIAELILNAFRQAYLGWSIGSISDEAFEARALQGLYICLLSDATGRTRAGLVKKIQSLGDGGRANLRARRA